MQTGEWWMDDSGGATYADGDIGDVGHEMLAIESALGISIENCPSPQEIGEWLIENGHATPEQIQDGEIDTSTELGYTRLSDGFAKWLLEENGSSPQAVQYFRNNGDARLYAIQFLGWTRVAGANFETWVFNDKTLANMRSFIYEAWEEQPPAKLGIEERSSGGYWQVPAKMIMNPSSQAEAIKAYANGVGRFQATKGWIKTSCRLASRRACG